MAKLVLGLLMFIPLAIGCGSADDHHKTDAAAPAALKVFAAASLINAVEDVATAYTDATGIAVTPSFAPSSMLARQLVAGTQADLFLSANERWMRYVLDEGIAEPAAACTLLTNRLAVIAPADKPFELTVTPGTQAAKTLPEHLALGNPDHVPAGIYAREALENLGWWDTVADRVVAAPDVRIALSFVEVGEAGAGIVYLSDALSSERVVTVAIIPETYHTPVLYYGAVLKEAAAGADAFMAFLHGPEADAIFARHGFGRPGIPTAEPGA